MKNSSLVSVIMPVYNAEKFLKQSIDCVLGQSHANVELILVNDGSTDASESICNEYAQADNRIKVVTQENGGPAAARNNGVRNAMGDFVFFLDADDLIDTDTFSVLLGAYDPEQTDLVMGNFRKLETNGAIIDQSVTFAPDGEQFTGEHKELSGKDIGAYVRHFLKHPSNHLVSYCWGRLYKLSVIREHSIVAHGDMRLFEDFVFNLRYLEHCKSVIFVNRPLYTYVMHANHASASMAIMHAESLLHDMGIFKSETERFFHVTDGSISEKTIQQEVGHALTHYVIIFTIRSSRLAGRQTWGRLRHEIGTVISSAIFKKIVRHYAPQKGNSRVLPFLARFGATDLIIAYCWYKANKRYGKIKK